MTNMIWFYLKTNPQKQDFNDKKGKTSMRTKIYSTIITQG